MSLCENEKNQNGGRTEKNILSLYENENLKKGDKKKQKNIMSLCENEKNQKGGQTEKNPSYPCMKMKISKRGRKKNNKKKQKKQKHLCPNIMNSPTLFITTYSCTKMEKNIIGTKGHKRTQTRAKLRETM